MSMRAKRRAKRQPWGYRPDMAIARSGRRLAPVRRPEALEAFMGKWVAVEAGDVIAVADSSKALAYKLHKLDHQRRARATIEFVRPNSDAFIVGAG